MFVFPNAVDRNTHNIAQRDVARTQHFNGIVRVSVLCRLSFRMTADALLSQIGRFVNGFGIAKRGARTLSDIAHIRAEIRTRRLFQWYLMTFNYWTNVCIAIMTDFASINHVHCKCALTENCRLLLKQLQCFEAPQPPPPTPPQSLTLRNSKLQFPISNAIIVFTPFNGKHFINHWLVLCKLIWFVQMHWQPFDGYIHVRM